MGRTLPPAAAPLPFSSLLSGVLGWCRGASETRRFQGELSRYHATDHVYLVSSGKAALYLSLRALHALQPERDEVVIPAFTCYSVPSAIIRAGLRIRLCDLDPDTLDYDYARLGEILRSDTSSKILSIVSIHLFGMPAGVSRVRRLVDGLGIKVVEDAAQSMGARVHGRSLGTLGDVGIFSLARGKALSTVAGGVALTADSAIATAMTKEYRRFQRYTGAEVVSLAVQAVALWLFINPRLFWLPRSLPFLRLGETRFDTGFSLKRMSGFQAGLAKGWERRLERGAAIRRANARKWTGALRGVNGVQSPPIGKHAITFLRYPLRMKKTDQRRRVVREGARRGLGIMPGYPDSLDGLDELKRHVDRGSCPNACELARQVITLPVHGYVTPADRHNIYLLLSGDGKKQP